MDATADYRADSDPIGHFLSECTQKPSTVSWMRAGKLYEVYEAWCKSGARDPISMAKFGRVIKDKGVVSMKSGHMTYQLELTDEGLKVLEGWEDTPSNPPQIPD